MEADASLPLHGNLKWDQILTQLGFSLLTFWHLPTTAQLTTESVPANAAEGSDVLLRVHNLPENLQGYYWYKGESAMDNQQIALYVIRRETIYHNGSLLLEKVTQKDIGFYTLQKLLNFMKNVHLFSLLSFWNLLTTAQLTIESVPANAAEGSDVLLRVHNSPENLQGYYWYKGESAMDNQQIALYVIATQETRPGSVYSGREMIYHNGSLLLQNVTQKDTGFYTLCTKTGHLQIEEVAILMDFSSSLVVSLLTFWNLPTTAQLTIESVPANAVEGSDVLLRVHNLPENLQGYYWYKGESAMDNQQIALYVITIYPNGSLLFQNVAQKDTGFYTLQTLTVELHEECASVQLFIFTELPKPFITSTNSSPVEGKDSVALMCEPETPDTTYLWWINGHRVADSDSLELSKDNRTLTLLRVTRNDTGNYECGTRNPVSANRSDPVTLNVLCE
uniref:Ig-like domain-containing protein n=1 Tax=Castor canadensis TaxID=51338 RepID=A0A8C0WGZ5_CASCN